MSPRRKSASKGPTPVEAIRHDEKRTNIPTDELRDFVDEPEDQRVLYPRDPSLDPQLVWKGKDEQDREDLAVKTVPIYIQEKIEPRVLIENLRDTAGPSEAEPGLSLFDDFDGDLEFEDLVDFYEHEQNWSNRLILGDSLLVMNSLAEKEGLRGTVQMVYVDPPYGVKFNSNWQVSTRKRDVGDGPAGASRQPELVKAYRDTWELAIHSYLAYLRDRLVVARELLTESGSMFVQISDTNQHLVRSLLDEVFGAENFVSQISFQTTSGFESKTLATLGDYLLWYSRDKARVKARSLFEPQPMVLGQGNASWVLKPDGTFRGVSAAEKRGEVQLPESARPYKPDNIKSQGGSAEPQVFEYDGKPYEPGINHHWKANYPKGMQRLADAGRIHVAKNSIQYRRFADDFPFQERGNFWTDTITGSFTDDKLYVVQTNTKVIERCLLLATDPGDLVVDPTCGGGTTALVAERHGRRWITTDTSRVSLALTRQRLMAARHPAYFLADSAEGRAKEEAITGVKASPGEPTRRVRAGFVYARAAHITLGSIARNTAIRAGMTPDELEAAIASNAEQELLYDQPPGATGRRTRHGSIYRGVSFPPQAIGLCGAPRELNRSRGGQALCDEHYGEPQAGGGPKYVSG